MKRRIIRKLIATLVCVIVLGNMGLVTAYEAVEGYKAQNGNVAGVIDDEQLTNFITSVVSDIVNEYLFFATLEDRDAILTKLSEPDTHILFDQNAVYIWDNDELAYMIEDIDLVKAIQEEVSYAISLYTEDSVRRPPGYKIVLVAVIVWVTVVVPIVVIELHEIVDKITGKTKIEKVEKIEMVPQKRKEIRYEERLVPIGNDYVNTHDNVDYDSNSGAPVFITDDNYWNNL